MRLKARIERQLAPYRRIAVWGAGSLAVLAMEDWLPRERVAAVIDRDPGKRGKPFYGLTVTDPGAADLRQYDVIVVCISAYLEAFGEIAARGDARPHVYIYELFFDPNEYMCEMSKLGIDYHRARNRNLLLTLMTRPQFLTVATFRLTRYFSSHPLLLPLYYLFGFLHCITCGWNGIDLPTSVQAGPGLLFAHVGGAVLHRDTVLGAFVNLYQFTTLGSDDTGAVPRIGSFVTVYAGGMVLGGASIGDHSRVGANATVLALACEAGSALVGTPARAIRIQHVLAADRRLAGTVV